MVVVPTTEPELGFVLIFLARAGAGAAAAAAAADTDRARQLCNQDPQLDVLSIVGWCPCFSSVFELMRAN